MPETDKYVIASATPRPTYNAYSLFMHRVGMEQLASGMIFPKLIHRVDFSISFSKCSSISLCYFADWENNVAKRNARKR